MSENYDFRPVREIYKHQDLSEVKDDIEDDLYNRKWEIFNRCFIKASKDQKLYSFFWKPDFKYERTLKLKVNKSGKEVCYDSKRKEYVTLDNSAYYLALRESQRRARIYPKTGWLGSNKTSCCEFRFIVVKNAVGSKLRYVQYRTRLQRGWSPLKFIRVKTLNPSRKKKIIRKLVKSGANKQKIAEFFKISLRRVQHITKGFKQKKFNPEVGAKTESFSWIKKKSLYLLKK